MRQDTKYPAEAKGYVAGQVICIKIFWEYDTYGRAFIFLHIIIKYC